jgi:putative transposase
VRASLADPRAAVALAETSRQFTTVFNAVTDYEWAHGEKHGVRLHHATYHTLKADWPARVSDHHVQARVRATEAGQSALTLQRKGLKVSQPRAAACPPRHNRHTYKLNWTAEIVNLAATRGRQRIPFRVLFYAQPYVWHSTATSDLMDRQGRWWRHVVADVPPSTVAPSDAVVGVDLGLAQPAVTRNNRFLGKPARRNLEAKPFKFPRALQAKGT